MKCPHCGHHEDHVIDSRPVETGNVIRRRRGCMGCGRRFTTYERLEVIPLIVLKSDNRREPFDRNKLREGIARACKNRKISADQIERLVSEVESAIQEDYVMEVPSRVVGDLVLKKLKALDQVAYIRFASVYKQFSDLDSFLQEVQEFKQEQRQRQRKSKASAGFQNGTSRGWEPTIPSKN